MSERWLLLGLACLNLLFVAFAALHAGPSRFGGLLALTSLVAFVLVARLTIEMRRARRAASAPPAPALPLRAIDQEAYAALLRAQFAHHRCFAGPVYPTKNIVCLRCKKKPAQVVEVRHPIWDGPFEEAGSGVVDSLLFYWCLPCDGSPPRPAGSPVRLPYLGFDLKGVPLPVTLLPELFARPAFHKLLMPVELYVPPPAPAEPAPERHE